MRKLALSVAESTVFPDPQKLNQTATCITETPPSFRTLNGPGWMLMSCTEICPNPMDSFDPKLRVIFRRFSADKKSTMQFSATVGAAPWLSLGSIWSDGHLEETTSPGLDHFDRWLHINAGTVRELLLGSPALARCADGSTVKIGNNIIPYGVHAFGPGTAYTRLVAVEVDGDPYGFLIPAYALIQFYCCPSTDLAQAVFSGGLTAKGGNFFDPGESGWLDQKRRVFRVRLRRPLCDGDAAVVARFAAAEPNDACRRMFARIHRSLRLAWLNGTPPEPSFEFPFAGVTRLTAFGRRFVVQTPDGPRCRFLALQMSTCSAPFPFRSLEIEIEQTIKGAGGATQEGIVTHRHAQPTDDASLTSFERPDPLAGTWTVRGKSLAGRFSYLAQVEIKHKAVARPAFASPIYRTEEGVPADRFATGPLSQTGTGVGRVKQVAPLNDPYAPAQALPAQEFLSAGGETFALIIDALNARNVVVKALEIGQHVVKINGHSYGGMPDGKSWHLLKSGRRRALFAAELICGGRYAYLFDIEREEGEKGTSAMMLLMNKRGYPISEQQAEDVLRISRRRYSLWNDATKVSAIPVSVRESLGDLTSYAIAHSATTAEAYAGAVLSSLGWHVGVLGQEGVTSTEEESPVRMEDGDP